MWLGNTNVTAPPSLLGSPPQGGPMSPKRTKPTPPPAPELTPEEKHARRIAAAIRRLEGQIEYADRAIAVFKNNLDQNPAYAFEWSQTAIEQAGKKEVATYLLTIIRNEG